MKGIAPYRASARAALPMLLGLLSCCLPAALQASEQSPPAPRPTPVSMQAQTAGQGWSEQVGHGDYSRQFQYQSPLGGDGKVMVVWFEFPESGARFLLKTARYEAGSRRLSDEQTILAQGNERFHVFAPSLVADGQGNLTVVWSPESEIGNTVLSVRYQADSGRWGAPLRLDRNYPGDTTNKSIGPVTGIDAQGNVFVAWDQQPRGSATPGSPIPHELRSTRYDARQQTWSEPQKVNRDIGSRSYGVDAQRLVVDDSGFATLAWRQQSVKSFLFSRSFEASLLVARYDPQAKQWSRPRSLATSDYMVGRPVVAGARRGDVAVLWYQTDGLFSAHYTPRTDKWQQTQLDDPQRERSNLDGFPPLAMDPAGNVVTLWNSPEAGIQVTRYEAARQAWSAPLTLASLQRWQTPFFTTPEVDAAGNIMLVWNLIGYWNASGSRPGSAPMDEVQVTRFSADKQSWSPPLTVVRQFDGEPLIAERIATRMDARGAMELSWWHQVGESSTRSFKRYGAPLFVEPGAR